MGAIEDIKYYHEPPTLVVCALEIQNAGMTMEKNCMIGLQTVGITSPGVQLFFIHPREILDNLIWNQKPWLKA